MFDFDIQRCTRRCAATGRELEPGEEFYSALISRGAEVARCDYAVAAWTGPPENTVGWWKSRLPTPDGHRKSWAPSDIMLDLFLQLEGCDEQEDLRYVLTLLMTRRRILRHETTETGADGHEWLVLFCPRNEQEYRVKMALPGPERVAAIEEQLSKLLQ